MIKRLTLSVMLLAMAAFAMTGAATAYFSDSADAAVTISTGNPDLQLSYQVDCVGTPLTEAQVAQAGGLSWTNIAPGQTTQDCITVTNNGTVPLDVSLSFTGVSSGDILQQALRFNVTDAPGAYSFSDGEFPPYDPIFTNGVPVFSGGTLTTGPGESVTFRVGVLFVDSGGDQTSLANQSTTFTGVVEGRTP